MTMQLLEALTILTAGNSGEINYHANDESFAIMQDARSVVGATATQLMDARHLTSNGKFSPRPPLHTSGKATATWGDAFRGPGKSHYKRDWLYWRRGTSL